MSTAKGKLFVSFWNLCLDNLALGAFRHRCLEPEAAHELVMEAQSEGRLLWVSDDDLLAPYHQRELQKHQEFCHVLASHFRINLSIHDFIRETQEAGESLKTLLPLQLAKVHSDQRLLIITCAYSLSESRQNIEDAFQIAPDTIEFHLIEAI